MLPAKVESMAVASEKRRMPVSGVETEVQAIEAIPEPASEAAAPVGAVAALIGLANVPASTVGLVESIRKALSEASFEVLPAKSVATTLILAIFRSEAGIVQVYDPVLLMEEVATTTSEKSPRAEYSIEIGVLPKLVSVISPAVQVTS